MACSEPPSLTFSPRIRGIRRWYKVRVMPYAGDLWLSVKDAGEAIGWHPDTFRHRRDVSLAGDAWGYATLPTTRGDHIMMMVAKDALKAMLSGVRTRQGRAFRAWLDAFSTPREAHSSRGQSNSSEGEVSISGIPLHRCNGVW